MKTLLKTLLLILPLVIISCNDDAVIGTGKSIDEVQSQIGDADIQNLVSEADTFAFLMETGRVLRSATERDKLQVRGTIERVKASSILLDFDPNDRAALMSLKTAFKFFDKIVISERDQPRLKVVLNQARALLVKYAAIQGVALNDLQWEIFSYRFSEEITPFGTPDSPNQWSIRFVQQERYAINVRGENKTATLLSPTFDLTNVKNPGFSLRHSFQVEEHFLPRTSFNRSKILNNAFQAFVSTKFNNKIESYNLVSVKGSPVTTYDRFLVTDNGLVNDGTMTASEAQASGHPNCSPQVRPEQSLKCIKTQKPLNRIVTEQSINIPAKQEASLQVVFHLNAQDAVKVMMAEDTGAENSQLSWDTISLKRTTSPIWDTPERHFLKVPEKFLGKKVKLGFIMVAQNPNTTLDLYYAALSARNDGEKWSRIWRHSFDRFALKGFIEDPSGNPQGKFEALALSPSNTSEERLWSRVNLGKRPLGLNFNTIDSGINDLNKFAGKKATLAMVYKNNNDLGNHILSWSIERFELYGVTDELTYEERPVPFDPAAQDNMGTTLWRQDFSDIQIGNLEQITLSGSPAQFRNDERNGKKWVRAGDINTEGEQLMYSPVIDLKDAVAPHIRINQTLNFYKGIYKADKDVRLQIAEVADATTEVKDLDWQILEFPLNSPPGDDWKQYTSEFIPLPENLKGKKVRVGWYHRSRDDSSPAWQIIDTDLRDIPELL